MKSREFIKEIKGLNAEDLKQRAKQISEELMKLRFRKSSGQLEQAHRISLLKRNLARVKTEINARG